MNNWLRIKVYAMLWKRKRTPPTEAEKVPPAERFGDPRAAETEWAPILEGGNRYRSQSLVKVHSGRLEYRVLKFWKFFLSGMFIFFVSYIPEVMFRWITGSLTETTEFYFFILGGNFIMLFFLGRILYNLSTPIVFDKHKGYFWRGRKPPYEAPNTDQLKDACHLSDIHALQLILKRCTNQGNYSSHELNLVLHDGTRINVLDHGELAHIRADAKVLADFLDVPLWDAV